MGKKILNGNYELGTAIWDTCKCENCGKQLTEQEQIQGATNRLVNGMMYWCKECFDKFFERNKRIFR